MLLSTAYKSEAYTSSYGLLGVLINCINGGTYIPRGLSQGSYSFLSATQPFLVSSRNAGGPLRDDTKNGCVADYTLLSSSNSMTFSMTYSSFL